MREIDRLQKEVQGLRATRVVTQQRGSWKYQDAYRLSSYHARLADNGKVIWVSYTPLSPKMSWPQIKARGYDTYERGSLHLRPVSRIDAVEGLGPRFVRDLERRGWRFGHD